MKLKQKKSLTTLDKSSKHPLDLFLDTLITQLLELILPTKSKQLVREDYVFDFKKKNHNLKRLLVSLIKFVYSQIFCESLQTNRTLREHIQFFSNNFELEVLVEQTSITDQFNFVITKFFFEEGACQKTNPRFDDEKIKWKVNAALGSMQIIVNLPIRTVFLVLTHQVQKYEKNCGQLLASS